MAQSTGPLVLQHGFLKSKTSDGIPKHRTGQRHVQSSLLVASLQAIRRWSGDYGLASSRQHQPHFVSVVDPFSCLSTFALLIFLRQPPLPPTASPLLCLTSLPSSHCCSPRIHSPHPVRALRLQERRLRLASLYRHSALVSTGARRRQHPFVKGCFLPSASVSRFPDTSSTA